MGRKEILCREAMKNMKTREGGKLPKKEAGGGNTRALPASCLPKIAKKRERLWKGALATA